MLKMPFSEKKKLVIKERVRHLEQRMKIRLAEKEAITQRILTIGSVEELVRLRKELLGDLRTFIAAESFLKETKQIGLVAVNKDIIGRLKIELHNIDKMVEKRKATPNN